MRNFLKFGQFGGFILRIFSPSPWLPVFHNVTHCLARSDDAVTVWTLKRRMCARRGETSGCKINHVSSESKQGGGVRERKGKIKTTSAKQQPLKSTSDVDALSQTAYLFSEAGIWKQMYRDRAIGVALRLNYRLCTQRKVIRG